MATRNLMHLLRCSGHMSLETAANGFFSKEVSCKKFDAVIKSDTDLSEIIERKFATDYDTSATIVMSNSHERLMGLSNGELVKIAIFSSENHSNIYNLRTVVVVFEENVPDSSVYITQALLFNLIKQNPEICCSVSFSKNYKMRVTKKIYQLDGLKIASKVVLCPVNSPCYDDSCDYGYLLKLYFSQTRIIQEGDILAVNSEDDPRLLTIVHGERQIRNPTIFFQVKQIHPNNRILVNSFETFIQQEKSVHSATFQSEHGPTSYRNLNFIETWGNDAQHLLETVASNVELWNAWQPMIPFYFLVNSSKEGVYFLVEAIAKELFLHYYPICCDNFAGLSSTQYQSKLKHIFSMAQNFSPCLLFFENVENFCRDQEGNEDARAMSSFTSHLSSLTTSDSKWPIIIIASAQNPRHVPLDIQKNFHQTFHTQASHHGFRSKMLNLLIGTKMSNQEFVDKLALQTGGMDYNHLLMLSTFSKQMLKSNSSLLDTDMEAVLKLLQATKDCGTTPKIPHIEWEDIGGLEYAKEEIKNTISLPLKNPHLQIGSKRSGILLFGPPGTGKTLIAKAVATECSMNFLSVKGPELLSMYVGQSEENIREVFARARSAAPCIVFFDELDSLVPSRGRMGDSGGVMDRVVSQLLAELDGINKSNDVYVIGTTNRPDLIDSALLRPGRFDKLIYLGVDASVNSKCKILKAITKKFNLKEVSLENVAKSCPLNMTGADFYVLCFDALLCATRRIIESALPCNTSPDIGDVVVREEDFLEVLRTFSPSLSVEELQNYNKLGKEFSRLAI